VPAVDFALERRAVMFGVAMGGGKTRLAIETLEQRGVQRALIVAPKNVVTQVWPNEFEKHASKTWRLVVLDKGTTAKKAALVRAAFSSTSILPTAVIVNYESVWRKELALAFGRAKFQALVCDEIHHAKAPNGITARFLWRLARGSSKNLPIPLRIGLTGTVVHDTPMDVFSQFRILDQSIFGHTFTAFKARYCQMHPIFPGKVEKWLNLDEMGRKMAAITYEVPNTAWTLTGFEDVERHCELEGKAARAYEDLKEELIAECDAGTVTAANCMVKSLRLQQVTSGFVKTEDGIESEIGAHKLEALAEAFKELPKDEPVVVFCRFTWDVRHVRRVAEFTGRKTGELSGNANDVQAWKAGAFSVLAVQIKSGKEGIDLTRARYHFYFSQTSSRGDYDQSRARGRRPGQTRDVVYVHFVTLGTIDQVIYRALAHKLDVQEAVYAYLRTGGVSVESVQCLTA